MHDDEIPEQPGESTEIRGAIPEHLKVWRGLYVRDGDRIVDAEAADVALARSYPRFASKGAWHDGTRITILAARARYRPDEEIRVVHVVESEKAGYELYIMGPKEVYGEYVNGSLVTAPVPAERDDPLIPLMYDGAVEPCPAVDYNHDITSYRFGEPGTYRIQWRLGGLQSNVLTLEVGSRRANGSARLDAAAASRSGPR